MRQKFTPGTLTLIPVLILTLVRCSDKCQVTNKYYYYEPVYATLAEIKAATGEKSPQDIKNPGKIYFDNGILFINEPGEGIHIFDNHDPSNPAALGFLNIPGNIDLAIKGKILYADSYVDLVAFDIGDLKNIKEIDRIEGLYSTYSAYGLGIDPVRGVITDWSRMENTTVTAGVCDVAMQNWGGVFYGPGILSMSGNLAAPDKATVAGGSTGIGGSMARFTVMNNYLYSLDQANIKVIDITTPANPVTGVTVTVGWDAQTLFPHDDNLFVGGRAGMYIFDLAAPDQPTLISQYDHILSCDPVVVDGDYAYVTLYSGDVCHVNTNQLELVSIKDPANPVLSKIFPMTNPHGLGINNGILFICDGVDGLKIYDAADPLTIDDHLLAHYGNITATDVIPFNNIAMMIGSDGIYQYDYSDAKNIKLLSHIPVTRP